MVRAHQRGQGVFRSIPSEEIDWKPLPAFPPRSASPFLSASPRTDFTFIDNPKIRAGSPMGDHQRRPSGLVSMRISISRARVRTKCNWICSVTTRATWRYTRLSRNTSAPGSWV
jgi:hypothetical protein